MGMGFDDALAPAGLGGRTSMVPTHAATACWVACTWHTHTNASAENALVGASSGTKVAVGCTWQHFCTV